MDRACSPRPRWPRLSRWLAAGLCAGAPLAGLGCGGGGYVADYPQVPAAATAQTDSPSQQGAYAPRSSAGGEVRQAGHVEAPAVPKEVPITLDAVLRLAEQHNSRLGLARERLHESQLTYAQAKKGSIPNVYASLGYYRHEGGIQQFDGTLTHSSFGAVFPALQIQSELDLREGVFQLIDLERRIWQNKAELSGVHNEILVEAATTYIDLLTARRGEAIARDLEKHEQKLLDRAERQAKTVRAAVGLVETIKGTLAGRAQLIAKFKQQGNAASAKLVYLLGLPPCTCLVPLELLFAPIELVDVTPSCCELVAQVLAAGPGVRELEQIIALSQLALEKTYCPNNYLPTILLNVCEGPFGAGPGASLAWDNRLDIGLQFRWNLTQICQTEDKRNVIRSRQMQAVYNYEDLKGKLAAGVSESRDAVLFGREQIGLAAGQIQNAGESYRLTDRRMEENLSTPGDVLLTIRNLEQAHFNHLQAIQNHNKAQVRLLMLLVGGLAPLPKHAGAPGPGPMLPPPKEKDKDDPGKLPPLSRK